MTTSRTKFWAIGNALVLALVIFWNYYANAQGINENSVGSLSNRYDNFFTPSSYAFSIWGLIYIALLINAVYQLRSAFGKPDQAFITKLSPMLIIANLANAAWIWLWLTERTAESVLAMLVILIALLSASLRLQIGRGRATMPEKRCVWWPTSLYAGWITVATVANISAYLAKINWQIGFGEVNWAVTMIIVATGIYSFVLQKRRMLTFALVGAWAVLAISIKQWGAEPLIQWVALTCAVVLVLQALLKKFSLAR
ncbi:hypothetical protein [Roseivirga misakiensis]|uniref:Tryptophan-rich sensory protein n=1 Tax=Roseivirga misakiensis TaxID=1563681 RepID=A0A1E5T300_9BACT|nr:hypothetical protein [Roseivirga misakiensis]OEK05721.1 hypothetical protein BFP71_06250 [Roseivirga misakiensis]